MQKLPAERLTARAAVVVALATLASLLPSCGSKTGLLVERCGDAGGRSCAHACGAGTQLCEGGFWGECVSNVQERECEDPCGVGTETCSEAGWSECVIPVITRPCEVSCGSGVETCRGGEWGECSFPGTVPPVLAVRVRDFLESHPDFERTAQGTDRGFIEDQLGDDDLPVYGRNSRTTSGREAFDQWYRDVPGVNLGTEIDLQLRPDDADATLSIFDDEAFFPIDDQLFGNEGRGHNFHFTLQAVTEFVYEGGETFLFRGDDDVFVFINRRLVIDLGGVHRRQQQDVNLDERREELGLEVGGRYPLHLFFAERHTFDSSFRIETTLSDPVIRCD